MATIAIPNPFVHVEAVGQADLVIGLAEEVLLSEASLAVSAKF